MLAAFRHIELMGPILGEPKKVSHDHTSSSVSAMALSSICFVAVLAALVSGAAPCEDGRGNWHNFRLASVPPHFSTIFLG